MIQLFVLCNNREANYGVYFFYSIESHCTEGWDDSEGEGERCYMWQLENCLDRLRKKGGILFSNFCAVHEAIECRMEKRSNATAWGIHLNIFPSSFPSFPLPPLSTPYKPEPGCCQISSWCRESNTLKTATLLNPPASHQLSDVAYADVFVFPASSDGQRWWRAGAAVISVSGTTEDSALRNVLGLWVCEWVVSCGKHPRAKRRVVSFTPRTALLPENEKPMPID